MLPERMIRKISVQGECWVWTGSIGTKGYGRVHFDGKMRYVHRVAYELLVGAIPKELQIDHLCFNKPCCNPAHLRLVTSRENLQGRKWRPVTATLTHCKQGHPFDGVNTYHYKGTRQCRTCNNERKRSAYSARKTGVR